ncbi:MAG: protocatechuate 3,4-dioxygenase subunit alpha [Acetobacteraceae bacterium]|nr:protocatechuate 3,4-dioxygenase subunit alpha [Acetobacteraceae bacterium]
MPIATASQTIGPYWHLLEDKSWADLTRFGAQGEKIELIGAVLDTDGKPCADACVEIWQADPPASDAFPGFGRSNTDGRGEYRFITVKPGPVPGRGNSQQAPHIAICVLSRGLMKGLVTRAYFLGEKLNETDPLLMSIEDPRRRGTLIASAAGNATWRLDIRLQGEGETVFLDV